MSRRCRPFRHPQRSSLPAFSLAASGALVLGALLVLASASPADAQGHTEHADDWRQSTLLVPTTAATAAGLSAARYELQTARPQPADGSIGVVLLRNGRPDPAPANWRGRPAGCAAATLLGTPVGKLQVRGSGGSSLPRLWIVATGLPRCSVALAPGIEGSDIGSGAAAPAPGIEGSPIGTAGTSAPAPGIEGSPIGTAGTSAPGPGIEGSDIGTGAAPAPGIEGTDVSTGAAVPGATDVAGRPPAGSLRQKVEAVLAAARRAQSAFPPANAIPEELRPATLGALRALAALASTPAADPRLVQVRLDAVEKSAPILMEVCAAGKYVVTGVEHCAAVARRCRAVSTGAFATCAPELAGCLGNALRSAGR
jgi:hypothetical protein